MTDDEVLQLAMYTAALDAKRFGAEFQPGVYRPTWEDRGPAGQEAYLSDARTQFEAVETIQRIRRPELPADETAEDPWAGFTGQSAEEHAHAEGWAAGRASRDAEVAELAQMKADLADWEQRGAPAWVAESRARFGDMEQRALAAEAVIDTALFQIGGHPVLYPRALVKQTLSRYRNGGNTEGTETDA